MADTLLTGTTLIEDKRKGSGEVWSAPGLAFLPKTNENTTSTRNENNGEIQDGSGTNSTYYLPVYLPDTVTVDSVIVWGSSGTSDETWTLRRVGLLTQTAETMATAAFDVEDTSITGEKIDNNTYSYFIDTGNISSTDEIHAARIKFTF